MPKRLPEQSQLENKHFVSALCIQASTHSGQACETILLTVWCEENSLPNKSQGTFPKHTGPWQGAKANFA
jgi:hypothetical protein